MKTAALLSALFFTIFLNAQTTISGFVSEKSGQPIIGANVYLKGTYDGGMTDANGKFSFETSASGEQTLLFSSISHEKTERLITIENAPLKIDIEMRAAINELTAVTITAGAMEASDEKRSVVIKPLDIYTTAGALGDVVGALNTLPGTATVANDGRLFVRGGDASETAIFFDGLRVGNSYGTSTSGVPTRTRFNSVLFKGTFFSTGGYSAEYGQALSSALVLNTVDMPLRDQTDLSLMTVGSAVSHTKVWKKSAATASINYTDLSPYQAVVPQSFDWERAPWSLNGEVLYRHKLSKNGILKTYYSHQESGLDIWQPQVGEEGRGARVQIGNSYDFANASFRQRTGEKWLLSGGASLSRNEDRLELDGEKLERRNTLIHGKLRAEYFATTRLSVSLGGENFTEKHTDEIPEQNLERSLSQNLSALFTEANFYVNEKLVLRGGLRGEYQTLDGEFSVAPRVSAALQASKNGQFSIAYGEFFQDQNAEQLLQNNNLEDARATHLIANYQYFKENVTLRAEVFYKNYDDLVVIENNGNLTNSGSGFARGFDLFFRDRKNIKNLDYWVTYSFVDSKRKFGNYETQIQPSYAPQHNFSIVGKYWLGKLKSQAGMSWSMNDGYTYDNPNLVGEQESKTSIFSNLSLNWSYLPKPNIILHAAVTNVLGRQNIFGYQYSNSPDSNGDFASAPRIQSAKSFFFIGLFITLSSDKDANQLNNL